MRQCSTVVRVGSYLLLKTIFHWLYSVVLRIVFYANCIVISVRSIVLLAKPEARSMSHGPVVRTLTLRSGDPGF